MTIIQPICRQKSLDDKKYYEKPLTTVTLFTEKKKKSLWEKCFKQIIMLIGLGNSQDRTKVVLYYIMLRVICLGLALLYRYSTLTLENILSLALLLLL